jgi:hypothetical protein
LQPLIKKLDETFGRGASALEPRWVEIVGERLARVCRPQKLTKGRGGQPGVLELRVVGAAALLVQHQSAEILSRVNLFLGPGSVDRLRIAQGPVKPLAAPAAKPSRAARPPLPASSEAELAASVASVPGALKAALQALGRSALARDAEERGS